MKVKSLIFGTICFVLFPLSTWAQFYTIKKGGYINNGILQDEEIYDEEYFYAYLDSLKTGKIERKKQQESTENISKDIERKVTIKKRFPLFINVRDSLLFSLIRNRSEICLPLDYINITSKYGLRKNPFKNCYSFHDGIDIECNLNYVYSMLPGRVLKVIHSNSGYGNHVVLEHGHIQCLYGHLDAINVIKGDSVKAGTIVGISGNTGRSTGPHLHVKLSSNGRSLNPASFIACLNKKITEIRNKIELMRFGSHPNKELNISNLYLALDRNGIIFPKIVIAQALLETGYFTSNICVNYNNLFGLRRPSDGSYYRFKNWEESVKAYKDYIQYKYRGGDYYKFLDKIGYAEDPKYLSKVKRISESL